MLDDNPYSIVILLQNQVDTLREQLKGAVGVLISVTWPKSSGVYDRYKPDYEYNHTYLFDLLSV